MKRRIRLTEDDLHRIVKESVERILREGDINSPEARNYYGVGEPGQGWTPEYREAQNKHQQRQMNKFNRDPLEIDANPEKDLYPGSNTGHQWKLHCMRGEYGTGMGWGKQPLGRQ